MDTESNHVAMHDLFYGVQCANGLKKRRVYGSMKTIFNVPFGAISEKGGTYR